MAWWCNFGKDVLEVSYGGLENPREFEDDLARMMKALGVREVRRTEDDSRMQLVVKCSKPVYGISKAFEKNNCLELSPGIYTDGWEWYRLIAFSERDLKAFFIDLDRSCEVEITAKKTVEQDSVRDTFVITASNLLGSLTGNQTEALLLALNSGYYSVPKKATTEDVALKLGLPRTTFEERLRKAESKVLQSVAPYVQLSLGKKRKNAPNGSRARPRVDPQSFEPLELKVSALKAKRE
jgi:predicted DNA binding protein